MSGRSPIVVYDVGGTAIIDVLVDMRFFDWLVAERASDHVEDEWTGF